MAGTGLGLVVALALFGTPAAEPPARPWADVELAGIAGPDRTLAELGGAPAVVNLWASWCTPCVDELPDLEAAAQRWGDRVTFLGVAHRDDEADARRLAERAGVTYPLAFDPDGALFEALGLIAMPSTVVLDESGEIVAVHAGRIQPDELESLVAPLV